MSKAKKAQVPATSVSAAGAQLQRRFGLAFPYGSWWLWPLLAAWGGVVLLAALSVDGWLTSGLRVRWEAKQSESWSEVAETVERDLSFSRDVVPLSRFLQNWNFRRDGVAPELFPFRATFAGTIKLPRAARFRIHASGPVNVWVDETPYSLSSNEEVAAREIVSPGTHRLRIEWQGDFRSRTVFFRPQVCTESYGCRPLDRAALNPAPATVSMAPRANASMTGSSMAGRSLAWCLALLTLLLGSWALLRLAPTAAGRARLGVAAAVVALVAVHLSFRLHQYDAVPDFRENGDELFATWNGFQLLEDGTTVGWSLWASRYPPGSVAIERLHYFGLRWDVIRPYLEHPPLLHLLVGAAAHLGGAESFTHAKLRHTRLVPIGLSVVTLLLMLAVGRHLDPRGWGPWLAAGLYASLPLTAIQGRVIKEEALVAPLAMGSVWCWLRWRAAAGRGTGWLLAGAVCAAACTLAKVPGVAFAAAYLALVASEVWSPSNRGSGVLAPDSGGSLLSSMSSVKLWRQGVLALMAVVVVTSVLLLYGAWVDWDGFVAAARGQGHRPTHPNIFVRWFHHGLINHNTVGRGWAMFLWLAAAIEFSRQGLAQSRVLTVPLVFYWIAITVGSGNWTFGWYMMPLYPFLCLGAGAFVASLWSQPRLLGGLLLAFVLVAYSANFLFPISWLRAPENWPMLRRWISLVVVLVTVPWIGAELWPSRPWFHLARGTWVLLLFGQLGMSGYIVWNYGDIAETHKHFDHIEYFDR